MLSRVLTTVFVLVLTFVPAFGSQDIRILAGGVGWDGLYTDYQMEDGANDAPGKNLRQAINIPDVEHLDPGVGGFCPSGQTLYCYTEYRYVDRWDGSTYYGTLQPVTVCICL